MMSRLGYRFFRASTYYEFGLQAYEAFVICSFMVLMCNFLGSERHSKIAAHDRQGLIFPFCCIKVRPASMYFLESVKWCVLQFAIVAPAVSITAIILQTQNLLCPGSMSLAYGNSWLEIIKTVSVTVATYFLIEFYYVIHKDIAYVTSEKCMLIQSIQATLEVHLYQTGHLLDFLPRLYLLIRCLADN